MSDEVVEDVNNSSNCTKAGKVRWQDSCQQGGVQKWHCFLGLVRAMTSNVEIILRRWLEAEPTILQHQHRIKGSASLARAIADIELKQLPRIEYSWSHWPLVVANIFISCDSDWRPRIFHIITDTGQYEHSLLNPITIQPLLNRCHSFLGRITVV